MIVTLAGLLALFPYPAEIDYGNGAKGDAWLFADEVMVK